MNKLFTKIASVSLGLALAAGVGVALGQKGAVKAKAASQPLNAYWTEVTALSGVNETDFYTLATSDGNKYMNETLTNGHFQVTAYTASSPATDAVGVFKFVKISEGIYAMKMAESAKFVTATKCSSGFGAFANSDDAGWLLSYDGTAGGWDLIFQSELPNKKGDGTGYVSLRNYNNGSFRTYLAASQTEPATNGAVSKLYKYEIPSKTVTSLTVLSNPTKTSYTEGDALDLTGVSIQANWSDSTTSNVTGDAVFTPANGTILSPTHTSVSVAYGGKTTSISITVAAKVFATYDMYITSSSLGLTTSYSSDDVSIDVAGDAFSFGRTDVMQSLATQGSSIQLKATTGKLFNKSKFSAAISKVYFLADANGANAPSNWAVYGSASESGSTSNSLEIVAVDSTNRIYSVDFSANPYYYFTVAKTGSYATYFDMIVVELVHSDDDVAAVRGAASSMLSVFGSFCSAGKGPASDQWNSIKGHYNTLTSSQKAIFDACVLNTADCNSGDAYGAPVQGTDLQKAVQKIEYCVSHYGVENFTGRTIEPAENISLRNDFDNNDTIMIIVVITAGVSALAFGALLLIKKKKHN